MFLIVRLPCKKAQSIGWLEPTGETPISLKTDEEQVDAN